MVGVSLYVLLVTLLPVAFGRSLQGKTCKGINLWTMDEVRSHSTSSDCLVVLYDEVYDLKAFADIHRGGSFSITRNCGKDATFGYESLVCIPGVPDHTRGVLNMVSDVKVGVIEDSTKDPCGTSFDSSPVSPPNFDACGVYDVVTCSDLATMPHGGQWDLADVQGYSGSGCVVKLFDYVFDVGSPPQDNVFTPPNSGSLTFADKHGGGSLAVLTRCQTDMTAVFEALKDRSGVPDHTKGALNAILPYLVGVVRNSVSDPCKNPPPPLCEDPSKITYWTMSEVQEATDCVSVVMGKVYNLEPFAPHHYGGSEEIWEHCRQDITSDFLEKSPHTLAQLGAIQQFQVGVISGGQADPCGESFVQFPDPQFGDSEDSGDSDENSSEDGGGFPFLCFPGESQVQVQGRGLVDMKDLAIGDFVLVDHRDLRYEPVYSFGHKDKQIVGKYLQLRAESGVQLEVSHQHLVFVSGKGVIQASLVQPGDVLLTSNHQDVVVSISKVSRRGAYAPFTSSGSIVVDGVKASCFVALQDSPDLVVGGFSTGLSFHWIERAFQVPHSFWCSKVWMCTNEEYNSEGISTWAKGPYSVAHWFLRQNRGPMIVAALPLFIWISILVLLEWAVANVLPITLGIIAFACSGQRIQSLRYWSWNGGKVKD